MKLLQLLPLTALIFGVSAHAKPQQFDCVNAGGSRMQIGRSHITVHALGANVEFSNVGGPLSELLGAKGYLAANQEGYALHLVLDVGPIIGDPRFNAKANADLLTNDGQIIHLEELFCQ